MVPTARTEEKVKMYQNIGFGSTVLFDLCDPTTWENLPSAESVAATIVTFAMDKQHIGLYEKLWTERINANAPVLCLGTSSVFAAGSNSVNYVDEDSPLEGIGVRGNSLTTRIDGESWAAERGAVVLHLSGLCGNEVEDEGYGLGLPRYVGDFARKGYLRNGLKLINLIHVDDIGTVIANLLSHWTHDYRGRRILVSSGGYMSQDIVKLCNLDSLPVKPFPDPTMKGNKIILNGLLKSIMPETFEFTPPMAGLVPHRPEEA